MVFAFMNVATAMAATVRGCILDNQGEALMQASVRILQQKDSVLVKGAVTDAKGRFTVSGVKPGKYIVEASYVGFATQMRDITVADKNLTLKNFELAESSIALRDAVVTGIRTPIKVMEDTVEFNADSYKTQPNAVVEDLLKRLPGVEVSTDGKITANGKEIKKILVDGKEFFSDDPTVASKNLPVNMIDKLQVVDRKSDLARLTGVDDGDDETVINLTVKKGMNNGWFGNVEAGYGTDDRYKGNFILNHFWNGNQMTIVGGANNVNEPGFADMASGRFRRFGGDNGITTSQQFGLNFNIGKEEIFRVGGDVMYSHTDRDTRTSSDRQYLFTDSTSLEQSRKLSRDKGHNVSANFRVLWNPDSFNTFEFRPEMSLSFNKSASVDSAMTFANSDMLSPVNKSYNTGDSDGKSFQISGRLIYTHKFRSRPGRSFSVMANYSFSNLRENEDSYSRNLFYLFNDSTDIYDQYSDNHTWSNSVSSRVSWTEPLWNKNNFLTLEYRFSYRWNNADKLTYDRIPRADGTYYYTLDEDLSNRFRNDFMENSVRLGYRYVSKNANLNVGVSLVPQSSQSKNLLTSAKSIPRRNVLNFAPFLRYRLKITKTRSFNAFYNGRSSQPSMTQLQPVADMSNPLNIVIGNPALKPSFTHNANLRFQDFNSEAQRSIMAMLMANMTQNSIVTQTTNDSETGGRTTTYRNVNGIWSVRGMNMISLPLRNKAFTINNHIFLEYSRSAGYTQNQLYRSGNFGVRESFGIAWRPENVELELRPSYSFQNTTNTVQKSSNRNVHTYGGTFYGTYYTPIGIVLNTDLNYSQTSGYSDGYDTKTWMWNASISYQFLSGKEATISLKAYDILGQRSNIRRSVTDNYISDSRYNSLTRYIMVTASYRFNTFKKGGEPDVFDGGAGGPDRHRMGPPPGGHGRPSMGGRRPF